GVEFQAEHVEVHDFIFHAERVVEPALGDAAVQRHLAALETALELEPRAGLRALVPAARGLAVARALPAADPLLRMLHAPGGLQIVETHNYSDTSTRCLTLWIIPRTAGVSFSSTVWRIRRR